jgi:DNA-binding CsgD family transcriptional regulator
MRVLLVGSSPDRARLRSQMNGSMEIAGEFASLAAARASEVDYDGILVAGRGARFAPARDVDGFGRIGGPGGGAGSAPTGLGRRDRPWSAPDEEAGFDEPLTPREIQVVELLAEGLPNKAIARRLGISDQTVKFHVSSIAGKLGAANRTDAVRRAVRRGLITL